MERRLLSIGAAGLVAIIALVSCRAAVPRVLPPEDVLRHALLTNATTRSVAYRLSMTVQTPTASGTLLGSGTILDGGAAWFLHANLSFVRTERDSLRRLSVAGLVVSPYPGTAYVKLHDIGGMLSKTFPESLHRDIGEWRLIGVGSGSLVNARRDSLDPVSVERIFSVLRVTTDHGMSKSPDGVYEYHYSVATTTGAALPLHGDLTIDARNFTLRRASWTFDTEQDTVLSLTADFSQYGYAPSLPLYDVTSNRGSLDAILNTISASSLLPTLPISGDTDVHDD